MISKRVEYNAGSKRFKDVLLFLVGVFNSKGIFFTLNREKIFKKKRR